ncbi:MAG: serine hydrolase domain-containing protein [Pseudomonadota bacterium]
MFVPALGSAVSESGAGLASFVTTLETLRLEASIPGLSVAVVEQQRVRLAAGLGFADLKGAVAAAADTPYNIASVTKPISAVLALKLVEQGRVDLDRPMADYSRWIKFCEAFSQQPSIFARELRCEPATHTLRHLLSHIATGSAGSAYSYNPILFSWASRPLMAVTDASFSESVAQLIFAPADMQDSARQHRALPLRADLAERLAPPHQVTSDGVLAQSEPPPPQGDGAAGGVISTVLDLAKFDIALDRGELISLKSRAEMLAPTRLRSGETAPYGLGWYVQEWRGMTLVWHAGWWEKAYSALYLKVPSQDVTLILLANSEGLWWGNPLDGAEVQRSPFAQAFLAAFVDTPSG